MKGSSKSISFPDFIHLYESASASESLTSDHIPEQILVVSPASRVLLNKNYPMGFVLVLANSEWVKVCARSMLLQLFHWETELMENNGITIYSKSQLAYNQSAQPYHWLYCESTANCEKSWVEMLGMLSFSILIEEEMVQQYKESLAEIVRRVKSVEGVCPQIYILTKTEEKLNRNLQFKYINIGQNTKIDSADPQFIQSLFQNGKNILSQGKPFHFNKKPVSASLLPHFLDLLERKQSIPQSSQNIQEISLPSIFKEAESAYEERMIEESIDCYKSKMSRLQDGKKTLPLKIIKNTHEMALEYCIKMVQKNMCFNESIEERICEAINDELREVVEAANQNNYAWGKDFLNDEFASIQKRVREKQIKNCQALRQEAMIFRDFYHKKTEQLNSKKLDLYFEEFLILQLTECSQILAQTEKKEINCELTELQKKLSTIEVDNKEHRKMLTKKNSESQSAMETLLQKVSYYSNRQSILEATISQLKKELGDLETSYDDKISQIQNKFLQESNNNRKDYFALSEEMSSKKRELIVLESEIQKQKLLHQQSKTHYEALLKKQKQRQEQLEFKIQSMNLQNIQELEMMKRQSQKSISDSAVSRINYQKQFQKVSEQLNNLTFQYEKLEERYKNLQYEMDIKQNQSQLTLNQMEIALKKSEQNSLQLESRIPRYRKYEEDFENLERIVEDLTSVRKENQKQNALLTQECLFLNQKIATLETKTAALKSENTQLKQCVETLQEKQVKKATKIDEWVQTDLQTKQQQQLEEALKLTHILEEEYNKLKRQLAKQSRGQMFIRQ